MMRLKDCACVVTAAEGVLWLLVGLVGLVVVADHGLPALSHRPMAETG
jgi:hypothetical protein